MLKIKSDKIKNFIKESYKLVLITICFLIIFNIKVPYYIYNGGGVINISDRIDIKNVDKKSNINMTYVSQFRSNLAALIMSYILTNLDREKITEQGYDVKDEEIRGKLELNESINNAKINVFKLLNKKYTILNHKIIVSYIDKKSETDLVVGDRITKVNDIIINQISEYKDILNQSNINDTLKLEVIHNGKKYKKTIKVKMIESKKLTGIGLADSYNVNNDLGIKINFKNDEYGPSAGLMMSLALYDKLSNNDIVKNRMICGTGTIDSDGNIGEIGGVKYKLNGAVKNKCNLFLVPIDNYTEATKEKEEKNYNIKLIKVKNLEEAINFLLK